MNTNKTTKRSAAKNGTTVNSNDSLQPALSNTESDTTKGKTIVSSMEKITEANQKVISKTVNGTVNEVKPEKKLTKNKVTASKAKVVDNKQSKKEGTTDNTTVKKAATRKNTKVNTKLKKDELNKSVERTISKDASTISSTKHAKNKLEKIIFQVKYSTRIGQSIYVAGNHPLLGSNNVTKAFPLNYLNEDYWVGILEIPEKTQFNQEVQYNYFIRNNDDSLTMEWGNEKSIDVTQINSSNLHVFDSWNDASIVDNTFYTEPFQEVLLKDRATEITPSTDKSATHLFKVKSPLLEKGQVLCILGSSDQLGNWDTQNPVLLSHSKGSVWHTCSINLAEADFPIAYKYGLYDYDKKEFIAYEESNNRVLYENTTKDTYTIVNDGFVNINSRPFRGAGVAIPVFSLRSKKSFGVGEFNDIKLLIDWAKNVGIKLIQILPVNDTTATNLFTDSYPYAAISAFALHPLYLHLPSVVSKENAGLLEDLNDKQIELNDKSTVDYVQVMEIKWSLLRKIFSSQKEQTFISKEFKSFFYENAHWLVPYAVFSYLREQNGTADFSKWTSYATYNRSEVEDLAKTPETALEDISIFYFVQYHLHLQLKDAKTYAHQHGIIVKGDIPIGIYRHSADAWQDPSLYNMNMQAGAPPDDFAVKGQNWGFPTYNWHKMKENGFEWWKKRFKQMSYYFDAFRIDHILGFFRIWSIPLNAVQGILGHFVPAVPVHIHEFHGRGIYFDYDRFCKPYITEGILSSYFNDDVENVKSAYFDWHFDNRYKFKSAFDTQRKVENYFATLEQNEYNTRIKEALFELIANIILIENDNSGGTEFHFRIGMESTISFQHLDNHTRNQLKELYLDYFYKRQDDYWRKEAMQKLPELKRSTNMLICGEDLGMVPASVPGVMHDLAILSLEIQRMPKDPKREFFHPNEAPYLSVVTPSTHDMSTIRGWWEEDRTATQRFFNNELGQWGTAPHYCEPWICRIILLQHFYSPAMWSIFQMQDLLSISSELRRENPQDERINIPADPKHYWRYRMHINLEQLLKEDDFNNEISSIIKNCGR